VNVHPLVARLVERHGAQPITLGALDAWLAGEGDRVLFFSGDPLRFPEGADVAVVLPELQAAFDRRFGVGVVQREDEDRVAARFGVQRWPSLVFLRGGRYVTTIAGMRDWDAFVRAVAQALEAPPARAPTVGIAVVGAEGGDPACL
jgi:hydrogenase-1 operon protein HyaE